MKFSILTPTHNRADVLPFAVQSALAQTENDWELLIVGDGCTDHTASVVAQFRDPRVQWFDLPKGIGFGYDNRNFAFRRMRGKYVAYLPHDDLWFPDHLSLLARCLEENGAEWAYSRPIWVEPDGALLPGDFDLGDAAIRAQFLQRTLNGVPSGCVLHRRDCFGRYGYWNNSLPTCGDWDMWARIIDSSDRLGYLSTPTSLHFRANWRTQSNALSHLLAHPDLTDILPRLAPAPTPQQSAWQCITRQPDWVTSTRTCIHKLDQLIKRRDQ